MISSTGLVLEHNRAPQAVHRPAFAAVPLADFAVPVDSFDEPFLGLDAVARQLFRDRLLADHAEHPRTIVLST